MINSPRFNYIITIHNKEDMIEEVIMSVLMCCRDNSYVYPVIDGCTDKTELIIDRIIATFSDVPITKVHAADIHELLSINAGLRAASQEGFGYNIVLQDDVILADFMLEQKVARLYEWAGPKLGYLSFRMAANLSTDALTAGLSDIWTDVVENAYGHGFEDAEVLLPGYFAFRSVPIKSPVCFPFSLIRDIGLLEEQLAPYAYDDLEYSIRSINAGYKNGVYPIRFYSDIKWGGSRSPLHSNMNKIQNRNINFIREKYCEDIGRIISSKQQDDSILLHPHGQESIDHALAAWNMARQNLNESTQQSGTFIDKAIRYISHRFGP